MQIGDVNSIASIIVFPGDSDPNTIIYMFGALGGAMQLIIVLFFILVLVRCWNLIPLTFLVLLIETGFRSVVGAMHPMTAEHFVYQPPGTYVNLRMLLICLTMLYLSTRTPRDVELAALSES